MTDVFVSSNVKFRTELTSDPRLAASIARLERDDYSTTRVIAESVTSDWPGDVAGRLLLTTSRLVAAGYSRADRVTELFEAMLVVLDAHGYFGEKPHGFIDEQQVACHGWVVSGLLQYGLTFGEPRALPAASRVVETLILPAVDRIDSYPRRRVRGEPGEAFGHAVGEADGWRLSTDTMCILLCLNALVPLYEVTARPDVRSAIQKLMDLIEEVDLIQNEAQLHASLAAARNLARYAELTGDKRARSRAITIYEQYANRARTLNWATYNWFERPNTWTEPCAIVDSIGLAFSLWRLTNEPQYLRDVDRIEHSALGFAERPDGSFGLDTIATVESPIISPFKSDARWCCTMRGGLGVIDLRDRSYLYEHGELHMLLPRSGRVELTDDGGNVWRIDVKTDYPASGKTEMRVVSAPSKATPLITRILLAGNLTATLMPVEGMSVTFRVPVVVSTVALGSGRELMFSGPELLVDVDGRSGRGISTLPRDMTDPPTVYRLDHPAPVDTADQELTVNGDARVN